MADQVLPLDAVAAIRHPQEIYTDAYLNDPIRFASDARFEAETVIRQTTTLPIVDRDAAEFITININSHAPALVPIRMYSHVLDRASYLKFIDRSFRFFPRTP